ncbi:MAG: large conductance mechanosensitive channel protein MscL [Flectobacillus sp.]|jgi:large conductance mechanosensitive channel|nr:large conductance mechanosensitive channel protein MscL [Flectobacillus sp.]
MLKEFKQFISQGNVLDLAVGVIIAGAFGKITTALVDGIIMPIVGIFLGGIDFKSLMVEVGSAKVMYGNFIQTVVDFLVVAYIVFLIVKAANKAGVAKKEA